MERTELSTGDMSWLVYIGAISLTCRIVFLYAAREGGVFAKISRNKKGGE